MLTRARTHAWAATTALLLAGLWVLCYATPLRAAELWTPETGEVQLEELQRDDSVEGRLQYAYALIGVGRSDEGAALLRRLIGENPAAGWLAQARLAVGRALLNAGRNQEAFDELTDMLAGDLDPKMAGEAALMRIQAIHLAGLGPGLKLLDRLSHLAQTDEDRAEILKTKADLRLAAGHYMAAMDGYLVAFYTYPNSSWAPYCQLQVAVCEWELARWLDLGVEPADEARRSFEEFMAAHAGHPAADEARRHLAAVRGYLADKYRNIASYYIFTARKPWAAAPYLERMKEQFGSKWAARELEVIALTADAPLSGRVRRLRLPGVEKRAPETP